MKSFLRIVLIFISIILLINLIFFKLLALPLWYNEYQAKLSILKKYEVFLFADSHGHSIGEEPFEPLGIYNFSFNSDSYADMLTKMIYLVEHCEPHTILLSVDDHILSNYRENKNNSVRSINFCNYDSYKSVYNNNSVLTYFYKRYVLYYFPLLNTENAVFMRRLLLKLYFKLTISDEGKQNVRRFSDIPGSVQIENAKKRKLYQFTLCRYSTELEGKLHQIIDLCEKNDVRLIGVKFPLTQSYINELKGTSFNADSILQEKSIRVFDFKKLFTEKDEYFKDIDHLNQIGGKFFATALADSINENIGYE